MTAGDSGSGLTRMTNQFVDPSVDRELRNLLECKSEARKAKYIIMYLGRPRSHV